MDTLIAYNNKSGLTVQHTVHDIVTGLLALKDSSQAACSWQGQYS